MKKSLVVIALVVAVLCSLFVFSASATEVENIHISSTDFQVRQGEEFTTTIYIAENANIIDFEALLKYDTDKLTLINAVESEDIKGAVVVNVENAGYISINYSRTSENVVKQTMLVDLTFRVDEYLSAGVYDCLIVDKNAPYVAHKLVNGVLEEVDFNCEFAMLSIYEVGDVDLNNKVDIGDATYIRRHLAKLHTLTDFQLLFANTQNDGVLDIADAVALQRKLAKDEVENYGDRVNVLFCNTDGEILTKMSVVIGEDLNRLPDVPALSGYTNGRWSASKTEYVAPNYTNLTSELTVYAVYEKAISPYMQYYISQITAQVEQYNGVIKSDWVLPTQIEYVGNTAYNGKIVWTSSDANVFSNGGKFNEHTYDKTITFTAEIYSYLDGTTPESSEKLTFTLLAKGAYSTPTKAEIVNYLKSITNGTVSGTSTISGGEIDCDLNLIRKISNEQVGSASGNVYEVRIEWLINNNGVYEPISQIQRGTSAKTIDLVATITFNGQPLEDDGKVYFDDVSLTAITEDEIRRYVIGEIASKVSNSFSNGDTLWATDEIYGCEIKWISKNTNAVVIEENTVAVNIQAIDGVTCPIAVQVSYPTDSGSNSFELEYVITVENPNNTLLRPDINISESLYYALILEMRDRFGYTQLTTEALKNTRFVSLDLSKYNDWFEDGAGDVHPPITDLTGLTYCENLRLLNVSDLSITSGVSEIAGLTYLESFIANNVDISSEAVGGTPIFSNMMNLKLVDLSNNDLTSLDMFFSADNIYSKLKELYLDNNNLSDISLLSQTPMLTLLTLSNNDLESDDIAVLADKVYLTYLSLNNNRISDISSLSKLTALTELRLHNNSISNIEALKNMSAMTKLYLGNNSIDSVDSLEKLTLVIVLFLNNNADLADISAIQGMTGMEILNISNCSVDQIKSLSAMSNLKELHAENNQITAFDVLSKLTTIEKLLLAGNLKSGKTPDWNEYLGEMANLKALSLSGLDVEDLSFLLTQATDSQTQANTLVPKPIERLEIAGCGIESEYIVDDSTVNNIELITKLKATLKYLDISNNPIYNNIADLSDLSGLELLYADNVEIGDDIVALMANSQSLKYLSLENCNISNMHNIYNKPWLATSRKYVFVDLAQNPIGTFDFSFVENSASSLKYLYMDTVAENAILSSTSSFDDNVLLNLSLIGFKVNSIELLPDMQHLAMLNISNTNIRDLLGEESNGAYSNSIARFSNLKYIDLGGNIGIFTHDNLNVLYEAFNDSGALVYLYDDHTKAGFDLARDIAYVNELALQDSTWNPRGKGGNIVCYNTNNENALQNSNAFNGFDIVWTVESEFVKVEENALIIINTDIPTGDGDEFEIALEGHTELYGQDCIINASIVFYKEGYSITYVLDSKDNSYSNRAVVNDSRNVNFYIAGGQEIAIYTPTRGEYDYFLGWYEDEAYTIPFNNNLATNPRNVTLYAKWDVATYYDSIDETIWSTPSGRVVIDWSKETETNLLNHTGRVVNDGIFNNIDIGNTTTELTFIGTSEQVFENFRMHICRFVEGQKLTIRFINFNFTTNEACAIGLYEDEGVDLTIEIVGDCSINSSMSGGSIIGDADLPIKNLTFVGDGNMNITAGHGADGATAGADGADGGTAVYAETLVINIENSLTITGGNGGNGMDGAKGSNGNTSYEATLLYTASGVFGLEIQSIFCYHQASSGLTGQKGGSGGNSGRPIEYVEFVTDGQGTINLMFGNGGNGAKGGQGGDGGQGAHYYGYKTGASYLVCYNPGQGGNAGNGGRGGDAGHSVVEEYDLEYDNIKVVIGEDGIPGEGGDAGNAGAGGVGGETHATANDHYADAAIGGNPGMAGADGNP